MELSIYLLANYLRFLWWNLSTFPFDIRYMMLEFCDLSFSRHIHCSFALSTKEVNSFGFSVKGVWVSVEG